MKARLRLIGGLLMAAGLVTSGHAARRPFRVCE